MEHSHSLSGSDSPVNVATRPLQRAHAEAPASIPIEVATEPRASRRNARRLQLRHSAFRGAFLPARDELPSRRTSSPQSQQAYHVWKPRDRTGAAGEATEASADRGSTSPSPTNILLEISNHATTRRSSSRSFLSSIFSSANDSAAKAEFTVFDDENLGNSHQQPNELSPRAPKMRSPTQDAQGRRSAIRSTKANKVLRKPRSTPRASSFDASKYIDHLESELASVNAKLDALASPSSSKAQSARIKALNRQTQTLRQEVADWEQKFEERVDDQVFERSQVESSLNAKIRQLKDELEAKDIRNLDLQRDVEALRDKLQASETLERDLSRRIDVLTELLAQSPTRATSQATSPMIEDSSTKRRSRPTSMILPTLQTSNISLGRFGSLAPLPSLQITQDVNRRSNRGFKDLPPSPDKNRVSSDDPALIRGLDVEKSFLLPDMDFDDSGMCPPTVSDGSQMTSEYSSVQSAPSTRPTSLMSNSSVWSSWGVPLPPDLPSRSDSKSRKMRRFVAGATSLKPLLLPTTTAIGDDSALTSPSRQAWSPAKELACTPFEHASETWNDWRESHPVTPLRSKERLYPHSNSFFDEGHLQAVECEESSPNSNQDEYFTQLSDVYQTARRTPQHDSPATASSPILRGGVAPLHTASSDPSTPVKKYKDVEPAPSMTSGSSRTLRIQTPNMNLDALIMEDTPSKVVDSPDLKIRRGDTPSSEDLETLSKSEGTKITKLGIFNDTLAGRCLSRISRLVMSIKSETLFTMKNVFLQSWLRGPSGLGVFGWWLFGLARSLPQSSRRYGAAPAAQHGPGVPVREEALRSGPNSIAEEHFFGLPWPGPLLSTHDVPAHRSTGEPRRPCPDCVEIPFRRNLRLWCKFSLVIVLAVGIAIVHGPESLLEEPERMNAPTEEKSPS